MPLSVRTTVLNVVSDPVERAALTDALQHAGFGVQEATTGAEVIERAAEAPALIIFDRLPDMHEGEVRRRLRELRGVASIPVIQLNAGPEPVADAADLHLTAPAPPEVVVASARLLLRAGQAERLLLGFLETTPDAVALVAPDGRIVQVNPRLADLFGRSREELVGAPVSTLVPERFRSRHAELFAAFVAAPDARRMGQGRALWGLHRDGSEFPIDVALGPLATEAGVLVAAAIRDMSAQHRLELALRERTRELEEADRHKDLFLATLAHELRAPLAALANVGPLLRRSGAEDVRLMVAGIVERQTAHMRKLVEDLIDLSRVRQGKVQLDLHRLDLVAVVGGAIALNRPMVENHRHDLEPRLPPGPVWIEGDGTRLTQVVTNLLTNAARYTPRGGRIVVDLAVEQGSAVLRVRDSGIGLAPDMLSRVFELFTQVARGADDGARGLGIGLALVRRLVALHGGTVDAHSEGLGAGSEFVVRLPLAGAPGHNGGASALTGD